jgi:hypothetical protein
MRHHLLFSATALCLIAGAQAAYGACPNGSNTTTSATFCSGTISTPETDNKNTAPVVASPYPAPITVSGMAGAVSGVSVTISGWNYPNDYPYTLELMLVSPGGSQALVFFAGNCGDNQQSLSNFTLNLTDTASGIPPNGFNMDCSNNATYKPYGNAAFLGGCPTFAGATPSSASCANGGTTNFTSTFTGVSPNGTWNVYAQVSDDGEAGAGSLTINLNLTTEITQSATTTSVSVNPAEAFTTSPNNTSTYTATVTSTGGTVNEGVVQFYDNGSAVGSVQAVNGSGQASYIDIYSSGRPEGLHQITAVYTDSGGSFETSNNNSNPASLFIDNHTTGTSPTFCNSGTITISGTGNDFTTPYPQHVFVTGLSGSLAGVTLTLNNINTASATGLNDWKVLLVGPDGTSFVPMAFAGGHAQASSLTLNLSDTGTALLAPGTSNTAPTNNGTYLPTAYGTYLWPTENEGGYAPPQSGYNYPMTQGSATFGGTFASENINNPTQPWSLYISDTGGDADTVGGYCLTFQVNSGVATATSVSANPNPDITNTQVTLTATVTANSGSTPVTSGSVKFEQQGNPTPLGTASLNGSGQASLNFTPTSEGAYNITAIYSGVSGTYNGSQGSTTLQVDNQTTETNNGNNNYSFCNPGPITIGGGNAVPQQYPSRVLVSGLPGTVSALTLTLDSVSYSPDAADLEMLLAGPNSNNNIVFWGNVGSQDGGAFSGQNFTIQDGSTALPGNPGTPSSGTYAPTANSGFTLAFATPTPASPNLAAPDGTATLDGQFGGTNPNGYYSFFVQQVQSAGGDTGSVGQHCVNITVTPPVLAIAKSHTGSFTQGDSSDTYTITVSNSGPGSTVGTLTLTDTLPTGLAGVTMSETGNTGGGTGSDWSCTASTATCTRTTAMPSGESDTITLTVSVSYSTATGTNAVTNSVNVTGGGASNSPTATDQTTVNAGPVSVTISTVPTGLSFTLDSTTYTAPQTLSLTNGSMHTLATTSPQTSMGVQNTFSSWSDGGGISHSITISSTTGTASYTASFTTTYLLTTAASPTNGGTVSPTSGYYAPSTVVPLTATPASGYAFLNWTGNVANANSASTSVTTSSSPQTVTANFVLTTTVSVSPTSLFFPSRNVGTTSPAQTVTLTNRGSNTLTIESVSASLPDYLISNNTCSGMIASHGTCTLQVSFAPTTSGSRNGTLSFTDTGVGSPQTVTLTGSAVGALLTPPTLYYSAQHGNTTSATQTLTFTNFLSTALSFTPSLTGTNAGDFIVEPASTCPNSSGSPTAGSLNPNGSSGSSCTYVIAFQPTVNGAESATLSISDSAGTQKSTFTGTGVGALLTPPTGFFPAQHGNTLSPTTQTVTFYNYLNSPLNYTPSMTGANAGDFLVQASSTCANSSGAPVASTLAANSSCTFVFAFQPTVNGAETATLSISDADGTQSSTFTGTGVGATLTPPTQTMPTTIKGQTSSPKTLTLTNYLSTPLSVTGTSFSGANPSDFSVSGGTCPASSGSVPANSSCTYNIVFKPSTTGAESATFTVTDADGTQSTALSGSGH